eukprot:167417_1
MKKLRILRFIGYLLSRIKQINEWRNIRFIYFSGIRYDIDYYYTIDNCIKKLLIHSNIFIYLLIYIYSNIHSTSNGTSTHIKLIKRRNLAPYTHPSNSVQALHPTLN